MEYRNELKYLIDEGKMKILDLRLKPLLKLDSNIKYGNTYNIRSIYFDNYYNQYFYDNDAGVNERLKIRIRIYNRSPEFISLEIKYKKDGMTKKESCRITEEVFQKILNNKKITIDDCKNEKVLYKLYIEQHLNLLVPKIVIEYDRTAYISKVGNVRITFDQNIRASKKIEKVFDSNIATIPILDIGTHILEVKYDEILSEYIKNILEISSLQQTTFSKYYLSRIKLKEEVL